MIKKHWKILTVVTVLLLTLIISYFYYYLFVPSGKTVDIIMADSTEAKAEVVKLYGLPVDSFRIECNVIKSNQMLLNILSEYNLPEGAVTSLVTKENPSFDYRKIRSGNRYVVFLDHDSAETLRYLVYEHTPVEYVLFSFTDSVSVRVGEKVIENRRQTARGVIETSLWNAMIDNGINPMLANELSEIYAWSIDFFGLQPLDSFKVVYDEQFVDTLSVGLGKIHAAIFCHQGKEYYAIPFTQDSLESYYDLEGNSLRKTFLKAPLRFSRISSRFSNSRLHPILKIRRPHHGVDYAAPIGTPVVSIGDGRIVEISSGSNKGSGNMIRVKHNGVYSTAYLHLSGFAKGIRLGSEVKQGDVIGYVGSSGLSTGPHLDFRFYMNGNPIDPLKVEAPPVEPVHQANMEAFDSAKANTLKLLDDTHDIQQPEFLSIGKFF
jgi:murein DD-endopeptidase MepM/ murein hydrolase activator NlpD